MLLVHPPTLGKDSVQLPLSRRPFSVNLVPSVASKLGVRSIPAPTWKRAPPAAHGRPSAPVCRELGFWLVTGSNCGSDRPRAGEAHVRGHTHALTLPRPRSPHPTLCAAPPPGAGWGWGDVRTAVPRRAAGEGRALLAPEAGGALGMPPLLRSSLSSAPAVALPAPRAAR